MERGDRDESPDRELTLFVVGEHEQSCGLCHECLELLLVVRHARREGGDLPVHVRVRLLGAETQHATRSVGTSVTKARDTVDQRLERLHSSVREVVGDSLAMIYGSDGHVAEEHVEAGADVSIE